MSLYHVLCLCFDVPCPSLGFKFLLCPSLCLPLSVVCLWFPSVFLLCAPPPLITTPGLLPPLSSPVSRLIIRVCVFSLCFPCTPCPVMYLSASAPVFQVPSWYVLVLYFFDLNFAFDLCLVLLFVLCLAVFVATMPSVLLLLCILTPLDFCVQFQFNKARLLFPPFPCPLSNCIWVQLQSP